MNGMAFPVRLAAFDGNWLPTDSTGVRFRWIGQGGYHARSLIELPSVELSEWYSRV
jgi:hypothetical protein